MKDEQEKKPPLLVLRLGRSQLDRTGLFHPSSFDLLVPLQGDGHQERVARRAG
jgi:hypothetical protein